MTRCTPTYCLCITLLVLGCLLLGSCRPRGILSSREMEDILVDLHIGDGIMYVAGYDISSSDTEQRIFAVLLEKRGVTQAQFDSSLVWYTNHPQRFDKIYPRVCARLTAERNALELGGAETLQPVRHSAVNRKLRPLDELMEEQMHGFKPLILRQTKEK